MTEHLIAATNSLRYSRNLQGSLKIAEILNVNEINLSTAG